MAQGLPNKLIAYELGLCETTIKAHVSGILRKLCVYSRARAIVLLASIDLASIGQAEFREDTDRPRHFA
jgi:DNA-binding NarL/FixJ family response regulator